MHLKIPTVREEKASWPHLGTEHAAAYDLHALLERPATLKPGERLLIQTGLKMAIPPGFTGLVCPRSGLALRHGVTVLNAPGILDADYRGDIGVILVNLSDQPFTVEPGDRVAQIVFVHAMRTVFIPAMGLQPTARGESGFGSTGRSRDATDGA